VLDLNNLSARRGFFDVSTPLSAQPELLLSASERKRMQNEMRAFCLLLREDLHKAMGRPNKKNLRNLFKFRVHTHHHADLVRLYFQLGDRIREIDYMAQMFRSQDKAAHAADGGNSDA
jgi:hypothetical protein